MSAPGDSPSTTDKQSVKPAELGFRGLKFLCNPAALKASARYAWSYARHCIFAAVVMTIAGLVNVGGTWWFLTKWKSMGGTADNPASGTEVIQLMALSLLAVIVIFGLVFWGFGLWLVCVTRYLRGYLAGDILELDAQAMAARNDVGRDFAKTHKKFLAVFWLVVTAIGFVPMLIAGSLFMVLYMFGSTLPRETFIAIASVECIISLALTNYSFVALAVSCVTDEPPAKAAWQALLLAFRACPGLTIISALMLLFSLILSYPMVIYDPNYAISLVTRTSSELSQNDFMVTMGLQFWQGLVSVFAVTWWFGAAAECVRGSIE